MAQCRYTLRTALFATTLVLVAGAASAAQDCEVVRIKVDGTVSGLEAAATGIRLVAGDTARAIDGAVPQAGTWRVTQPQFDQIKASVSGLSDQQRMAAALVQTRNGGEMVVDPLRFLLNGEAASRACGSLALRERAVVSTADTQPAGGGAASPATPEQCRSAGNNWIPGGTRYQVPVLFNSRGVHCYSPPVIRQGDLLVVGMVLNPGEKLAAVPSVEFSDCPPESAAPEILANGELPSFQSGPATVRLRSETQFLDSRTCGSVSPVISVKLGEGSAAVSTPYTLTQYKRYRATFHLGALYTDLHEPDFALRNDGTSNLIFDKEANERGPEYLAALIVPGIAHYVEELFGRLGKNPDASDPRGWRYKGYDPIHDGRWKDKLGLVITAGIENPGDRFGIGLSYEIAYGINLVGVYELAKIKELSGFAVGDEFTGTAEELPTRREWDSKFSIGLTFDLAYVTKLFSGATTGG